MGHQWRKRTQKFTKFTQLFTIPLYDLMQVMKTASSGKRTIQALGDKIVLSRLLENLQVPQMPLLFSVQNEVRIEDVDEFVQKLKQSEDDDAFEFVLKPTHLSNSTGCLIFSFVKCTVTNFSNSSQKE